MRYRPDQRTYGSVFGVKGFCQSARYAYGDFGKQKRLRFRRRLSSDYLGYGLLDAGVVLLAIDGARGAVLLAIHLPAFG